MAYEYNDGGRVAAGFKGECGDCATRAVAIALRLPYKQVYDEMNAIRKEMLAKARSPKMKKLFSGSIRNGTAREVFDEFMKRHDWKWVAKMKIGSGCTTHLKDMPEIGSYICSLAGHYCAVVDGTIQDIFNDSQDSCVYGYFTRRV